MESDYIEAHPSFIKESRVLKNTSRSSPTNLQAISSIYQHSRSKIYNRIIKSLSPNPSKPQAFEHHHSPTVLPKSPESTTKLRSTEQSPHLIEVGPAADSPSSFYYHKRRDMRRELDRKAKSEESKYSQIKQVEFRTTKRVQRLKTKSVIPKKPHNRSSQARLGLSARRQPISIQNLQRYTRNLREKTFITGCEQLTLPPISGKAKYNSKLQKIISDCETMPRSDFAMQVTREQQVISEINRQLQWTTEAINRIQDSDAAMLEYLFGKLEEEEQYFDNELTEAKKYFKYFSSNPRKQLQMVVKMLRRKKNAMF
jgi:hypothetical protein